MSYYLEKYLDSKVDLNITSKEKNKGTKTFYTGYLRKISPHSIFFWDELSKKHWLTNAEITITFLHYFKICKPKTDELPKANVFCSKDYSFCNCYLVNVCDNAVEIITENGKHIVLYGYSTLIDLLE